MTELALVTFLAAAGIPETLANDRAAHIRNVRYELSFRIPEVKTEPLRATETVRFELAAPRQVVLDFEQTREHIVSVDRTFQFADGQIVIPASATKAGENAIRIEFVPGDESLNRNDEFLYTLFVPARAHFAFPCFDQ